jgi:hypothetical protein
MNRRLHAPKAFGEEVTGSTPVFSTKRMDFSHSLFC